MIGRLLTRVPLLKYSIQRLCNQAPPPKISPNRLFDVSFIARLRESSFSLEMKFGPGKLEVTKNFRGFTFGPVLKTDIEIKAHLQFSRGIGLWKFSIPQLFYEFLLLKAVLFCGFIIFVLVESCKKKFFSVDPKVDPNNLDVTKRIGNFTIKAFLRADAEICSRPRQVCPPPDNSGNK